MCSCLFTNLLFSFWKLAVHRLSARLFLVLEGYNGTIQESHLPFLPLFLIQKKLEILLYRKKSPPTIGCSRDGRVRSGLPGVCSMLKTRLNGTERPKKDAGLRRGVAAAAVLLIVCVLAVGVVSADTVTVSRFDELERNITSASDDLTIIVDDNISIIRQLPIGNGKNITLTTDDADHTLSRDGFTGNLFIVNPGGNLTITGNGTSNLTLDGAGQDSDSLVKVNGGNFTLADGGILTNNTVPGSNGGGVYVDNSGTFTMSGGEISKNKASNCGGGVYVKDGMFTMSGGTISNNDYDATSGGGVYVGNGEFTMSGGTITNHMVRYGGGVYVKDGMFTMSGTAKISSNTAEIGGGVDLNGGTFEMESGTISNNKANEWGWGGGVYVSGGTTFTMKTGEISGNTASSSGGGVYLNGGTFEMKTGEISGNTASSSGGGVYVNYDGEFEMSSGTISDNTATSGGGVYVNYDGEFEMSGGEISGNTASSIGDGVYVIGIFELSGSSSVDSVYLTSEKVINVTAALTTTQVTDINLQSPVHGTKVVTISPSVSQSSYLNYFQLNASLDRFELEYQSSDIVLKQLFCIVSFNAQGGTPTPDEQSVQYDNPVTEPDPAPTWEGHTLEGWYREAACQNKWDFTTPVTSDITLYAGWKEDEPGPGPEPTPVPPSGSSGDGNMENAYRVLFNDGATTLSVVTDLSAGDKLTKPEDPVKDGYTFAGWHKDSACTQAWDFNDGITGDMTLYAKWTAIEATPTATATATATAVTTPQPTATQTTAAATSVPEATTAAAVSPTLVQTPAPVAGALLGLLAAGLLLRRRFQ